MKTHRFFYLTVMMVMLVINFANAQSRTVYRDSRPITTKAARSYQSTNGENRRYLKIDGNTSWYFKALGGYNMTAKGAFAGGAVGIRYNGLRVEVEGKWAEKNPSMLGVINYDIIKGRITPFVSVAAGAGKQVRGFEKMENPETGEIQGVHISRKFRLQMGAGGGISFRIAPHFQLEVGYRFNYYPAEKKFIEDRPILVQELSEAGQRTVMAEPVWKFGHELNAALRYHF